MEDSHQGKLTYCPFGVQHSLTNAALPDLRPEDGQPPAGRGVQVISTDRRAATHSGRPPVLWGQASRPMAFWPPSGAQSLAGTRTSAPTHQSLAPTKHRHLPSTTHANQLFPLQAPAHFQRGARAKTEERPSCAQVGQKEEEEEGRRGGGALPGGMASATYCRSSCSLPRRMGSGPTWAGLWP